MKAMDTRIKLRILESLDIISHEIQDIRSALEKGSPAISSLDGFITIEQMEELEYELTDMPELAEEMMDRLDIANLASMPKSKYRSALTRIRKIKAIRDGIRLSGK